MLRNVVLGLGALALAGGLLAIFAGGFPAALVCAIWGALIVLAIVFERFRYKPLVRAAPTRPPQPPAPLRLTPSAMPSASSSEAMPTP